MKNTNLERTLVRHRRIRKPKTTLWKKGNVRPQLLKSAVMPTTRQHYYYYHYYCYYYSDGTCRFFQYKPLQFYRLCNTHKILVLRVNTLELASSLAYSCSVDHL